MRPHRQFGSRREWRARARELASQRQCERIRAVVSVGRESGSDAACHMLVVGQSIAAGFLK